MKKEQLTEAQKLANETLRKMACKLLLDYDASGDGQKLVDAIKYAEAANK